MDVPVTCMFSWRFIAIVDKIFGLLMNKMFTISTNSLYPYFFWSYSTIGGSLCGSIVYPTSTRIRWGWRTVCVHYYLVGDSGSLHHCWRTQCSDLDGLFPNDPHAYWGFHSHDTVYVTLLFLWEIYFKAISTLQSYASSDHTIWITALQLCDGENSQWQQSNKFWCRFIP